jgi:hypothetical protein
VRRKAGGAKPAAQGLHWSRGAVEAERRNRTTPRPPRAAASPAVTCCRIHTPRLRAGSCLFVCLSVCLPARPQLQLQPAAAQASCAALLRAGNADAAAAWPGAASQVAQAASAPDDAKSPQPPATSGGPLPLHANILLCRRPTLPRRVAAAQHQGSAPCVADRISCGPSDDRRAASAVSRQLSQHTRHARDAVLRWAPPALARHSTASRQAAAMLLQRLQHDSSRRAACRLDSMEGGGGGVSQRLCGAVGRAGAKGG